ncbi:hypothetical protein [Streptomyces mayteni]
MENERGSEEPESSREARVEDDADAVDTPWWGGLGLVGGALLIVGGLAAAGVLLLADIDSDSGPTGIYGTSRLVVIGLVVAGGALVAKHRRRGGEPEES